MIRKTKLRQNLFDFIFAFWVIYYLLFKLSTFGKLFTNTTMLDWSATAIVIAGIVFVLGLTKLRKRDLVIVFLLILLGVINAYYLRDYTEPMLFLFLCAAKAIDISVTTKKIYRIVSIAFIFIVVLSYLGIIQNKSSIGFWFWDNRTYLGFIHPNNCGAIILNLILLMIYNNGEALKTRDYLIFLCLELLNLFCPKSKTSLILGGVAVISVLLLNKLSKREKEKMLSKFKYLPLILAGLSLLIIFLYYNNDARSLTLNLLLSRRVEQMGYYWKHYSITLFGQMLENVSSSQANTLLKMRALDNGFLYMLLGKGIVYSIVFTVLVVRSSIYFIKCRENTGALVLIIIMIWGLTETIMFRIEMNYLLLLLSKGIFESIKRVDYVKYKKEPALSNGI